jgi:hypothetical protein
MLSYDPDPDPDPARRRKKRARRRRNPARRIVRRARGLRFRTRAWPYVAGIGMARVFEKICDVVGLTGLGSAIAKPVGAYVGGKWKGLATEMIYELVDERTDDVWGMVGLKIPTLTLGKTQPAGGV